MARIEKTVFISYRRTNVPWALAISQSLTHHGYDVFFDFTGLASGDFESVILDNIHSRAHFLVVLTPSALERCGDPGDWLRREIEAALDSQRNIVPLMLEGFDFGTPSISNRLTGKLAALKKYNAIGVPAEYFDAAMGKLRNKYLNVALDTVVQPASAVAAQAATEERAAVAKAPRVAEEELTAQQWFERGLNTRDLDEKVRFYSEAIRLQPDYGDAFNNRAIARKSKGDLEGSLSDYDEAIRLRPDYARALYNRALTCKDKGDLDAALADFDQAIRLQPDFAEAFLNRGNVRYAKGDLDGALADFNQAIRLQPDFATAFYNRGNVRKAKGDLDGALAEYDAAIRLKPDYARAFNQRGATRHAKGDLVGALRDLDEAIRLKPDFAWAFYGRGLVRKAMGDFEGALHDFSEAIRIKPDLAEAVSNREHVLEAIANRSKI